jgi:hypothetical protein
VAYNQLIKHAGLSRLHSKIASLRGVANFQIASPDEVSSSVTCLKAAFLAVILAFESILSPADSVSISWCTMQMVQISPSLVQSTHAFL